MTLLEHANPRTLRSGGHGLVCPRYRFCVPYPPPETYRFSNELTDEPITLFPLLFGHRPSVLARPFVAKLRLDLDEPIMVALSRSIQPLHHGNDGFPEHVFPSMARKRKAPLPRLAHNERPYRFNRILRPESRNGTAHARSRLRSRSCLERRHEHENTAFPFRLLFVLRARIADVVDFEADAQPERVLRILPDERTRAQSAHIIIQFLHVRAHSNAFEHDRSPSLTDHELSTAHPKCKTAVSFLTTVTLPTQAFW